MKMKISMKEITMAINKNQFAPNKAWHYEEIELKGRLDSMFGKIDQYEVTVKFKADKYEDNGIKYLINHYIDENAYACFYNGSCYLG